MSKKKNKKQKVVKEQKKTNKTFFQILIEWLTWQKAGVIITGIGVIVSIIIYLLSADKPKSEIDTIKSDILNKVNVIENTFNPKALSEKDSLIADFEANSLELAALWKVMNEPISYKSYVDKDLSELKTVLAQDFAREDRFKHLFENITKICVQIRLIEVSEGKEDAKSVLSYSKLSDIKDLFETKCSISESHSGTCHKYLSEANELKDAGKDFKPLLNKAMEELEAVKETPEFYKFDEALFDFIIQTNNLYFAQNKL